MELKNYKDFISYYNTPLYGVVYSEEIEGGILPFADHLSTIEDLDVSTIVSNPAINVFKLDKICDSIDMTSTSFITFRLQAYDNNWDNIDESFKTVCKYDNVIFIASIDNNTNEVRSSQLIGTTKNIHLFTDKDECQKYIDDCNETILRHLFQFYRKKSFEYTRTQNKLSEFHFNKMQEKIRK